jgi:hypothetical protein
VKRSKLFLNCVDAVQNGVNRIFCFCFYCIQEDLVKDVFLSGSVVIYESLLMENIRHHCHHYH